MQYSALHLKKLFLGSVSFFAFSAYCGTAQAAGPAPLEGWWATVEIGDAFATHGNDTTVERMDLDPGVLPDNYVTNNRQNSFLFGVGAGYQFQRLTSMASMGDWFPTYRLGLFYDHLGSADVSGNVNLYQTSSPSYAYKYKVYSNALWLGAQFDLVTSHQLTPFLDLGIGAARNEAQDYTETLVDGYIRDSAAFANDRQTKFAYRLGFGLNYTPSQLGNHLNLSVLYRYADKGRVALGASPVYPTMTSGADVRLLSNELLFGLRYNF